ncbi:hypothetical protein [Halosimplex pelagicum]|uniref:Uncharacterized protein n=1 Tax=Halosimplex pelagicum TaxID=869886 RepID=A0A7D5P7B1_9EURY|nr:hypothetical protein [Halosimplex pelagicum]QLH82447.1 hypothetical protein HZS54_12850 [Halosimplex pelagicum]QLH82503.1 hypothetical protein HZS54_13155 [Halosimplex pelagicum]
MSRSVSASEPDAQDSTEAPNPQREYHVIPAEWAVRGGHERVPDEYDRFYAEVTCVEHNVETERESATEARVDELTLMHVLYRNPETDERVERTVGLSVGRTDADTVSVWSSDAEGDDDRVDYPVLSLDFDGFDDVVALPSAVYNGEPSNFAASIAVHPDEDRVDLGGE